MAASIDRQRGNPDPDLSLPQIDPELGALAEQYPGGNGGLSAPLLDGQRSNFDEWDSPPPVQPGSRWSRWGGRIVSLAGAAGSAALTVIGRSNAVVGLGSLGLGFFGQSAIQSGYTGEKLARIRQVSTTALGQFTSFVFTQVVLNAENEDVTNVFTNGILGLLGATAAVVGKWYWDQGGVRVETRPSPEQTGQKFGKIQWFGPRITYPLKAAAFAGSLATYHYSTDTAIREVASFFVTFFPGQISGELGMNALVNQIEKRDSEKGTKLRNVKRVVESVEYVVQTAILFPWSDPHTSTRKVQVWVVGGILGLCDGITGHSQKRRFEQIPIDAQEEFRELPMYRNVAHRTFLYAVPVVAGTSMAGFVIWQEAFEPKNGVTAKIELAAAALGFYSSYAIGKAIDLTWNPKQRSRLKDKAMFSLWVSPRILGITPLYLYYAVTNALNLDGHASKGLNPYHTAMAFTAWLAYGVAMGRELVITSSNRIGNLELRFPRMLWTDGAITTFLYMRRNG